MKKSILNFEKIVTTSLVAFGLVGCASQPQQSADSAAQNAIDQKAVQRSQAYTENTSFVLSNTIETHCAQASPAKLKKTVDEKTNWREMIALANACVAVRDWATVNQVASVMSETDLDSPWPGYFMSLAASETGESARALWMAELANRKSGGKIGVFVYQRARVYFQMKDYAKAMSEMQKALALDSKLVEAHVFLGDIHRRDMEWVEASKDYQAVIAVVPNHFEALNGLAESELAQGHIDPAIQYFKAATEASPANLKPWVQLANLLESSKKDLPTALTAYQHLKSQVDSGKIKDKPSFDLNAKIQALTNATRLPASVTAKADPTATGKASDQQKGGVK